MLMPKRSYSAAGSYRYGFNGKENDNDVKGLGNQQDYGMRIYDARVGRFLSVDPLQEHFPELTPYQFCHNSPVDGIDLDGLERVDYRILKGEHGEVKIEHIKTGPKEKDVSVFGGLFGEKMKDIPRFYRVEYNGEHFYFSVQLLDENGELAQKIKEADNLLIAKVYNLGELDGFIASPDEWVKSHFSSEDGTDEFNNEILARTAVALAARGGEGTVGFIAPKAFNRGKYNPTDATNKKANEVNGGNIQSAVANSDANATFNYEGQIYVLNATVPYKRPTNATTPAQRKAVNQTNAKCATCGTTQGPFNADHIVPLSIEHLSTGTIDKTSMRSVKVVQSQCKDCSNEQGGNLRQVTREANQKIKKKK
jgi:RHS repeat-associated protein